MKLTDKDFNFDKFETELYDLGEGFDKTAEADHSGHRKRVRYSASVKPISRTGMLEWLLFYLFSDIDTKPYAVRLIDRLRGLGGVFDASEEDIYYCFAPGGKQSEIWMFLNEIKGICSYYAPESLEFRLDLDNFYAAEKYFKGIFEDMREAVCVTAVSNGKKAGECAVFSCDSLDGGWKNSLLQVTDFLNEGEFDDCVIAHCFPLGAHSDDGYKTEIGSFVSELSKVADVKEFFTYSGGQLRPHFSRMRY